MIITSLKAIVPKSKWPELISKHQAMTQRLPSQIVATYLIQDIDESETWKLLTIWKSMEVLSEYRKTVKTPEGIMMFRSVGAEPKTKVSNVMSSGPIAK